MTCESCGAKVAEGSAFCPRCGAQLNNGEAAAPEAATDKRASAASRLRPASTRPGGKQPPEEELWTGTYSAKAMIGPAIGLGVLTILALVVGALLPPPAIMIAAAAAVVAWVLFGLALLYKRMTVRYRLTTFRLFHESGLLSRKRDRIEVIDINDVTLRQKIIERMFNVGTIHIDSSDTSHPDFDMPGIENVRQVADLFDNTRRAERERRGLFMENVGSGIPG
jgi:membrane protein YdbS with pleckstrin-like domain